MNNQQTIKYCNLSLALLQIIKIRLLLKKRKLKRRCVKRHITSGVRENFGAYRKVFEYFRTSDHEEFFKLTRMSIPQFEYLHDLLRYKLSKRSRRESLPTEVRLAVCLSLLAHGDSVATTGLLFRIGKSTIYSLIPEVCIAIWEVLFPEYLKCPQSENEWLQIANEFEELWNFPHCVGAVDGKHCRIRAPSQSGSSFHNYKGYFSIVLLAIVDARYRFISIDIGDYGSLNDAGIWSNAQINATFENNTVNLPSPRCLPNTNFPMPYYLVGDEGFPLKKFLMRPYARRKLLSNETKVFNYRLGRARRVVENAFGILAARWQILQKPIASKVETTEAIIQALTCLHNFIITTNANNAEYLNDVTTDREDSNGQMRLGSWRNTLRENNLMQPLGRISANNATVSTIRQRDVLADYLVSEEGSIPWQWEAISQ